MLLNGFGSKALGGKIGDNLGGKAGAAKLTATQRAARAKRAVEAREAKRHAKKNAT
jgi:hypothetical protein